MSKRPLRTQAGVPGIASSIRWMVGRTLAARPTESGATRSTGGGGSGEVEEMRALGFVQLQRTGQGVEDDSDTPLRFPRSRRT